MDLLHAIIGTDDSITWWQMSVRAVLIFVYALLLLRFAISRRAFGRYAAQDIVMGVVLGSTLSRALTGNAPFLPTLLAVAVLVLLHSLLAASLSGRLRLDALIAGHPMQLVDNGEIRWDAMRHCGISEHDLMEAIRLSGSTEQLSRVKAAYMERSGKISVVKGER
jgi:uncharacterized membrane protein YcaP (DUF421 family)